MECAWVAWSRLHSDMSCWTFAVPLLLVCQLVGAKSKRVGFLVRCATWLIARSSESLPLCGGPRTYHLVPRPLQLHRWVRTWTRESCQKPKCRCAFGWSLVTGHCSLSLIRSSDFSLPRRSILILEGSFRISQWTPQAEFVMLTSRGPEKFNIERRRRIGRPRMLALYAQT
ncbi:hypothetical protein C8T65DRAFT_34462 [Cerioporus squamosus]|nr:hypothetical protein C8T65DRAFT_34462 [Cerioporus squamosus]